MKLDNEEQRKILLEMISSMQVSGEFIDTVYELKKSIKDADIDITKTRPADIDIPETK